MTFTVILMLKELRTHQTLDCPVQALSPALEVQGPIKYRDTSTWSHSA